jgi:hypothetical protein
MRFASVHLLAAASLLDAAPVAAFELTGVWEISSLGADRRVEIWQDDSQLIAYRVLWPEFEGETYKLEHVFRARIRDNDIDGDLWVREEGMRNFDNLRPFVGRVDGKGRITLDGLPLTRTGDLSSKPPVLKAKKRRVRRKAELGMLGPVVVGRRWEVV